MKERLEILKFSMKKTQIVVCLPHLKERVVIEWMISWWTPAPAVGSVKLLWLENERETLEFPDVDLHRPGAAGESGH